MLMTLDCQRELFRSGSRMPRAKEKKSKLHGQAFGINQTSHLGPKTEALLCVHQVQSLSSSTWTISFPNSISPKKTPLEASWTRRKSTFDPATVRQLMAQQELDRIKKANEVLDWQLSSKGMFDNAPCRLSTFLRHTSASRAFLLCCSRSTALPCQASLHPTQVCSASVISSSKEPPHKPECWSLTFLSPLTLNRICGPFH